MPRLPESASRSCIEPPPSKRKDASPRDPGKRCHERPRPRDRSGDVIDKAEPIAATTLAHAVHGAELPAPNILSAKHLARIGGGLLYAATANVPWATLLARTFDVDVKSCVRCGGRLQVRAVVTDPESARKLLDALPPTARAPPPNTDSAVLDEPVFA